jgi:hypothetical protein
MTLRNAAAAHVRLIVPRRYSATPKLADPQLTMAGRHRRDPVLHVTQRKSVAAARITITPRQAIGPDINDLVPAKRDIIRIAGAAFREVMSHPLKLPPQPVFKHLFRSSYGSRVSPMISGYFLRTGHTIPPIPETMP